MVAIAVPAPLNIRRAARSLAIVLALATLSCMTTRNYLDPAGPGFEGSHALYIPPAPVPSPGDPIRVVTFNIRFSIEIDKAAELLKSSADLREFDILLLQEMDAPGVERLARALQLNYVYYPSTVHPQAHRDFGTAVLSPWTLDEPRKLLLPHAAFGTRARRAATSATVRRGALRIRAVAVHLPAPGAVHPENREDQIRVLLEDAAGISDAVVIGGDFNSRAPGPLFTKSGFLWLTDQLPGTSRGLGLWWSNDHVFTRGLMPAGDGPAAGVVDPAGSSDHRAVWVRLVPQNTKAMLTPPSEGDPTLTCCAARMAARPAR